MYSILLSSNIPPDFIGRIFYIIDLKGAALLKGAGTTLIIAIVSTIIGCLIGFIVGIIHTIPVTKQDNLIKRIVLKVIKVFLTIYVEVFRGTPMMVQAMFIFYGVAKLLEYTMNMWFAAFLIVSINTGAYMAETVRGGILSIDNGQTEGAKAIGMTHYQTMLNVILPQAFRNIMPQIGNNFIINIKDTCVLSVIGIVELYFVSKSISGSLYMYFEVFTVTMIMYLIMTVFFSRILRWYEKKLDGPKDYNLATTDTLAHTSGMSFYQQKRGDRY